MSHGDGASELTDVVTGLSASERESSTSAYFATFRWEPLVLDPERLTVAAFFAMALDDDD